MLELLFAGILFVASHLLVSNTRLRPMLMRGLGEKGYAAFYSVLALATLVYFIRAYNDAPRLHYFWPLEPMLYWAPKALMLLAFAFLAGGLLGANATPKALADSAADEAALAKLTGGINRITRHPVQWAIILWAASHLVANGDAASVVFFGGFLALSLVGSGFTDRKKARQAGDAWPAFAAATSNLPFAAIAGGRNRLVWRELAVPAAVGLALYLAFFWGHGWVSSVAIYW
ncbi:MAG: NnrU family protein [Gammaproteobacteria bacterium]|nr:NnrU family protein [Gammaproteobacteria bacterium]MCY4343109.1 NnrU family protein [Gammaproteobacteria bacterium]